MTDKFDRAIGAIFLRRKLRAIEAKRAKHSNVCKLNKLLARIRYPKTDTGRKRFIQNSLNPDQVIRTKNLVFGLLFIGLVIALLLILLCLILTRP